MNWKQIICCKLIHVLINIVGGLNDDQAKKLDTIITSISVDGPKG